MTKSTSEAASEPDEVGVDSDRDHLRRVIDESAFAMHFQPIVDLRRRAVFAYEALCRPSGDHFESPVALITAAVDAERIGELGRLQRTKAVKGCNASAIFLNLEPHEFDEPWLVRPDDPIFMHRYPVYLEITENVPLKYFDQCHSILVELRKKGTLLVIDDFGAGFSNLKYIAELEPDIVKLDRELIRGCKVGSSAASLLSSITALCHEWRAKVVAEGIETATELEAVLAAGIDFGQGYLLARPGPEPGEISFAKDDWPPHPIEQPDPIVEVRRPEVRTTLREDELAAEVERLNELLLESETGRLALMKTLRERSHDPTGAASPPSAEPMPDAEDSGPPLPEQADPRVASLLTETETPSPPPNVDGRRRARGYGAALLLLALITVSWAFWPTARQESSHPQDDAGSSTVVSDAIPLGPERPNVGAEASFSVAPPDAESSPNPEPLDTASTDPMPSASQTPEQPVIGEIEARVAAWAQAWSTRNVEEYVSYYSPDFEPANGASFRDWVRLRRQRIEMPAWIRVEVNAIETELLQPDRVMTRFSQAYSSPGYSDEVNKTLEWVRQGDTWRILAEHSGAE